MAAGILGAVVKDPVADSVVWTEYLEAVVRERPDWSDFYRACREVSGDRSVAEAVATEVPEGTYVLGVRHHGPGSARGVLAELDRIVPDVVLVEGPAEADPLVRFARRRRHGTSGGPARLRRHHDPARAVFWPFADFSPEWQALRWAVDHRALARFVDLPSGACWPHRPRSKPEDPAEPEEPRPAGGARPAGCRRRDRRPVRPDRPAGPGGRVRRPRALVGRRHRVPFGRFGRFEAITEAMASLREEPDSRHTHRDEEHEARREAYMRTVLREVRKGGARRIVVVCGAWHAPALTDPLPTAAADARVLRGCRRTKTVMTWVPWTHSRLSYASGYGAGIESPGWYHHLFTTPDHVVTRWLTKVAGRLREKDLPVSSAHVIEAVRLAEAVATMRGRPLAGLAEVTDATRSVLCQGEELLVELVTRDVVVGERLGTVPDEAPTVPLEADLRATARRLRLAMDPLEKALELDLRKPNDLARPTAAPAARPRDRLGAALAHDRDRDVQGGLVAGLAARAVRRRRRGQRWGTSVADAATARVVDRATSRDSSLATVTRAMEACLLGDLAAALPRVLAALRDRAALDVDVEHLMEALPALVGAMRYGDVRSTDTTALGEVATSLLVRIEAALPAAVTGLGDDAAEALRDRVEEVHAATALMSADHRAEWLDTLERLTRRADLHGLLAGRLVRLLADAQVFDAEDTARRLQRALSVGSTPAEKAAWIEGFLAGGGLLLVHDTALLGTLDAWLAGLRPEEFIDVLPLLRRTFGGFQPAERRQLAHQLRRFDGAGSGVAARTTTEWSDADLARATPAVATVARLLGLPYPPRGGRMTAERLRRWRLTLGGDSADTAEDVRLSADDQRMDEALAALYGAGRPGDGSSTEPRTGGLGGSAPRVATWLGDIRAYFPSTVVQVMQRDAIDRLGVRALLLEPELMESLEPDVHLVSTLISLGSAIPETSRATARSVVRTVVDDVEKRIANRTRAAVTGALNRAARTHRPKLRDIDWNRTIARNLKHYLPEQRTVVPERLVGYGRRQQHVQRDIILCDRPVRVDGRVGRVRVDLRRGDRLAARHPHLAGRLRHGRGRPHRGAVRPRRPALRDAARRWHRHQPRDRLLPGPRHPADGHGVRPHLRPVRGRRPRRDAGSGRTAA